MFNDTVEDGYCYKEMETLELQTSNQMKETRNAKSLFAPMTKSIDLYASRKSEDRTIVKMDNEFFNILKHIKEPQEEES